MPPPGPVTARRWTSCARRSSSNSRAPSRARVPAFSRPANRRPATPRGPDDPGDRGGPSADRRPCAARFRDAPRQGLRLGATPVCGRHGFVRGTAPRRARPLLLRAHGEPGAHPDLRFRLSRFRPRGPARARRSRPRSLGEERRPDRGARALGTSSRLAASAIFRRLPAPGRTGRGVGGGRLGPEPFPDRGERDRGCPAFPLRWTRAVASRRLRRGGARAARRSRAATRAHHRRRRGNRGALAPLRAARRALRRGSLLRPEPLARAWICRRAVRRWVRGCLARRRRPRLFREPSVRAASRRPRRMAGADDRGEARRAGRDRVARAARSGSRRCRRVRLREGGSGCHLGRSAERARRAHPRGHDRTVGLRAHRHERAHRFRPGRAVVPRPPVPPGGPRIARRPAEGAVTTAVFHRHCPRGFRAMGAIGIALCAVGSAQLVALVFRDEPHSIAAAVLALLLGGGGAGLVAFVRRGTRGVVAPSSQHSPSDALTAAALGVFACATLAVLLTTGIFFPARVALFWTGKLPATRLLEPPLAMMLAGTSIVALGAMATAALCGALWLFLYARGSTSAARFSGAALSFAGAVPYVAFALVVRALYCPPVAFLAAGRWLAVRPDDQLAYRSLYAMAPGYLTASVALGLCVGRGLWSFLEEARTAEERSDSFLATTIRGEKPWEIVLRQGLWQRRRRDLAALLLGSAAAAVLIDILSNTLIDSFRPPGFPTYPSLGAALFLRGIGHDGIPLPLGLDLMAAHVLVVLAALLLVVAQTFPHHAARIALRDGSLRVGARVLANGVASPHGLPPRPSLQWVLGTSGSGKSSLLKAWSGQLENAILVPQDPDEALPSALSGTDVARLASTVSARGDRVLWDLLGRLGDGRLRRSLFDPFTPVSSLSRGERQRLVVCVAMPRARRDPDCTLLFDEPTSAQDASRTRALLDCVRELLPSGSGGASSLVLAAHDPESLDALLGDRAGEAIPDHVLWLEDGRAHEFTVRSGPGAARQWAGATARPHGLQGYLSAMDTLLDARSGAAEGPESSTSEAGFRLLRSRIDIGGKPYAVSPAAVVRGGELFVLHGPSGCGKSTILRAIARRQPAGVEIGYVMQDPGRAFPAETPVDEVLGTGSTAERDRVRRWFGPDLGEEMRARPISALSEGERQRVVFAGEVVRIERAGEARLRLLLLDEPFGALDPAAHLRLMNLLLAWLREGEGQSAAVLVSHSPEMDLGLARACGIPTTEWTIEAGEG